MHQNSVMSFTLLESQRITKQTLIKCFIFNDYACLILSVTYPTTNKIFFKYTYMYMLATPLYVYKYLTCWTRRKKHRSSVTHYQRMCHQGYGLQERSFPHLENTKQREWAQLSWDTCSNLMIREKDWGERLRNERNYDCHYFIYLALLEWPLWLLVHAVGPNLVMSAMLTRCQWIPAVKTRSLFSLPWY